MMVALQLLFLEPLVFCEELHDNPVHFKTSIPVGIEIHTIHLVIRMTYPDLYSRL